MRKSSYVFVFLGFILCEELVGGLVHKNLVNDNSAGPDKNLLNEISSQDDSGKQGDKESLAEKENKTKKGEDTNVESGLIITIVGSETQGDAATNDSGVLETEEPDVVDKGTCSCVEKDEVNRDGEQDGSGGADVGKPEETGKGQSAKQKCPNDGASGNAGGQENIGGQVNTTIIDVDKPGAEIEENGEETDLETSTKIDKNKGQNEKAKDEGNGVGIGADDQAFTFSPLDS